MEELFQVVQEAGDKFIIASTNLIYASLEDPNWLFYLAERDRAEQEFRLLSGQLHKLLKDDQPAQRNKRARNR